MFCFYAGLVVCSLLSMVHEAWKTKMINTVKHLRNPQFSDLLFDYIYVKLSYAALILWNRILSDIVLRV